MTIPVPDRVTVTEIVKAVAGLDRHPLSNADDYPFVISQLRGRRRSRAARS
jgi:hypothetical protein